MSSMFPIGTPTTKRVPCFTIYRLTTVLLFALAFGGCNGPYETPRPVPPSDSFSRHRTDSIDTSTRILDELRRLLQEQDWTAAEKFVREIQENEKEIPWNRAEWFHLNLSTAKVAVELKRTNVNELLLNINARTRDEQIQLNRLWVEALIASNQLVEATRLASNGNLGFNSPQDRTDFVWSIVSEQAPFNVARFLALTRDRDNRGWWELAAINLESLSDTSWRNAWTQWKAAYPKHVANRFPPKDLQREAVPIHNIAVLLPQSGVLADAASSIRDGIVSAYQTDSNRRVDTNDISIAFLDTTDQDIVTLINSAFYDGADAVIGPLSKEHVEQALSSPNYPGPVLLLNHVPAVFHPNPELRQLALSVEDEAIFQSDVLRNKGQKRMLVVYGDSIWSSRAMFAFRREAGSDTTIIGIAELSDLATVTETIAELLDVNESTVRHERIATTTRLNLEFTARRRQDIEAIVAFVDAPEFEALTAALRYHFADDIDLYVTEAAVRDTPPGEEADGVLFSASPWLIHSTTMRQEIQSAFEPSRATLNLYALGIDAYRFVSRWGSYEGRKKIGGESGYYHLEANGTIRRTPVLGTVVNGELKPLATDESIYLKDIPVL